MQINFILFCLESFLFTCRVSLSWSFASCCKLGLLFQRGGLCWPDLNFIPQVIEKLNTLISGNSVDC